MLTVLSAFAITLAASGLIFLSWRRSGASWSALVGWLLAFGSTYVWSRAFGAEVGVVYAISVFVSLVWVLIAVAAPTRAAAGPASIRPYQPLRWAAPKVTTKHIALFLLSVPAMGVITMMLSVGLVRHFSWNMTFKFAVAMVLYPLLWGALSAWVTAQTSLTKPALVSGVLVVVAALLMFA